MLLRKGERDDKKDQQHNPILPNLSCWVSSYDTGIKHGIYKTQISPDAMDIVHRQVLDTASMNESFFSCHLQRFACDSTSNTTECGLSLINNPKFFLFPLGMGQTGVDIVFTLTMTPGLLVPGVLSDYTGHIVMYFVSAY